MITVYTTSSCAYCPMVKKYLQLKGVEYREQDVTQDFAMRARLTAHTGYSTVPVTSDGKTYVTGWKPAELKKLIEAQK